MDTFPLLSLPLVARLDVLANMEPFAFIAHSLLSRNAKRTCQAVNAKVPWCALLIGSDGHYRLTSIYRGHIFCFLFLPRTTYFDPSDTTLIQIDGASGNMRRSRGFWNFYELTDSPRIFEPFVRHFLDIFKCDVFTIGATEPIPIGSSFFNMVNSSFWEVKLSDYRVSGEEMRTILEDWTVRKLLVLAPVDPEFRFSGPLNMEILISETTGWLTIDALLTANCKHIELTRQPIDHRHVNLLLKKWISGGLPKLEWFKMKFAARDRDVVLNRCLEGVDTFPWSILNRPAAFNDCDLSSGRDFRREGKEDGKLGTVGIVENDFLWFVVWEETTC